MANGCEPPVRRRDDCHANEADRQQPRGGQSGRGARRSPRADEALPARRRGL